jgi:hypothetical protein
LITSLSSDDDADNTDGVDDNNGNGDGDDGVFRIGVNAATDVIVLVESVTNNTVANSVVSAEDMDWIVMVRLTVSVQVVCVDLNLFEEMLT